MRTLAGLAFAVSVAAVSSAQAVEGAAPGSPLHHRHPHVHRPISAVRDSPAVGTAAGSAPAAAKAAGPPGAEGNIDGLSRDPEKCNMGCLDTTE